MLRIPGNENDRVISRELLPLTSGRSKPTKKTSPDLAQLGSNSETNNQVVFYRRLTKMSHVLVSLLYMAMQLVVSLGFIYLCPNTVLAHCLSCGCRHPAGRGVCTAHGEILSPAQGVSRRIEGGEILVEHIKLNIIDSNG